MTRSKSPLLWLAAAGLAAYGLAACSSRPTEKSHQEAGPGPESLDAGPLSFSDWPSLCGKPRQTFSGHVCGRAAEPCKVQVNEVLVQKQKFWMGSLELDDAGKPMVTYLTGDQGKTYYFMRRSGAGKWSKEQVPLLAGYSTMAQFGGEPYIFAHVPPDMQQQILHRGAAGWKVISRLPGRGMGGWRDSLVFDQSGCMHIRAHFMGSKPVQDDIAAYGLRRPSGAWSFHKLSVGLGGGPIALGPNGAPHFAYWARPDSYGPSKLFWVASPGKPEVVMINTGSSTLVSGVALAVTAGSSSPEGTPHVFVERNHGSGGGELTLASRNAGGQWSELTIKTSAPPTKCNTSVLPTGPGQTCITEYDYYHLAGVLPGADLAHLRIVYGRERQQIRYVASCSDAGTGCKWKGESKMSGAILIASLNGSQVEHTTVLDTLIPTHVSSKVDAQGRIHMLVYGAPNFTHVLGSTLYYLRLDTTP
jgi:hypothetical protein